MNILILGGTGMIGSNLFIFLKQKKLNIFYTTRIRKDSYDNKSVIYFKPNNKNMDLKFLKKFKIIINAIGITNKFNNNINNYSFFNTEFPYLINKYCYLNNLKFIHLSTNCVFNGK